MYLQVLLRRTTGRLRHFDSTSSGRTSRSDSRQDRRQKFEWTSGVHFDPNSCGRRRRSSPSAIVKIPIYISTNPSVFIRFLLFPLMKKLIMAFEECDWQYAKVSGRTNEQLVGTSISDNHSVSATEPTQQRCSHHHYRRRSSGPLGDAGHCNKSRPTD